MKKLLMAVVVLFVSALVLTSCKKDKDEASIVGKWGITYAEWKETVNGVSDGESATFTSTDADYYTLELTSDGKFIEKYNDGDEDRGTYRTEGNKIYFKYDGETEDEPNDFTVNDSEFTRSFKESTANYTWEWKEKFRRL